MKRILNYINGKLIAPKNSKYIDVLGLNIFGASNVPNEKLIYSANILAQYLDNDSDGNPDNQLVYDELIRSNASMIITFENDADDLIDSLPYRFHYLVDNGLLTVQDLYVEEINPNYVNSPSSQPFDATLEDVLHLITHNGYSKAYPEIFGEYPGTQISNYMDIARGGQFLNPPWNNYPPTAWYTYDDYTCDYECMGMEYLYWCIASNMGAISNVCNQIDTEWDLCTPTLFQSIDTTMYNIITAPQYKLPQFLPDGNYCPNISYLEESYSVKKLVSIVNVLGETTNLKNNTILLYIYDDGTVKKIFNLY